MLRYGEKAKNVQMSDNWSCPKCRGVCNCSLCMKKKGHQPTGILIHAAKGSGFSSVVDLLDENGSGVLSTIDGLKFLQETSSSFKVQMVHKRSLDKENRNDEEKDNHLINNRDGISKDDIKKKEKTRKAKKFKRQDECGKLDELLSKTTTANEHRVKDAPKPVKDMARINDVQSQISADELNSPNDVKLMTHKASQNHLKNKKPKKKEIVQGQHLDSLKTVKNNTLENDVHSQISVNEVKPMQQEAPKKQLKTKKKEAVQGQDLENSSELCIDEGKKSNPDSSKTGEIKAKHLEKCQRLINKPKNACGDINETKALVTDAGNSNGNDKHWSQVKESSWPVTTTDMDLPKGMALVEIVGAELPLEVVGPALQFLEFCNAFSKVLGVKKGEPEYYLRDLARGHFLRRGGGGSPIINFLTKLFSIIQEDLDQKSILYAIDNGDLWLSTIVDVIDQPVSALKEFEFKCFPKNPSAYDRLDPSKKLKVLNFLCDEVLQTQKLRNWMESENLKYVERKKETKKTVFEAKRKSNDLKKKLKADVTKAMLSVRDGASLSIEEQTNLISHIREETVKAHAEMLEAMKLLPKSKQRRDAIRTDPVLCEEGGRVYWELDCNNSRILLQDVGSWNSTEFDDRWFSFDREQEKVIEQHISNTVK